MAAEDDQPTRGRPVDDLYGAVLSEGAEIGNYIVESVCSSGGFATVYRCRHFDIDRVAAVKVLHDDLCDEEMRLRFRREARAVNQIGHRNIVDVVELGELPDGRPYIVMEWLSGNDLARELETHGPLSAAEAAAIVTDVASALDAAHEIGIIHRDVKLANVMLTSETDSREVKLLDFGIAKLTGAAAIGQLALTRTGEILGTPHYMAPEQIRMQPVDRRSDVYSLGTMTFHLVTGRPAFDASSRSELVEKHLSANAPLASDIAPVPPSFAHAIRRAMEKDPDDRFETASAYATALVAGLESNRGAVIEADAVGVHLEARLESSDGQLSQKVVDDLDDAFEFAKQKLESLGARWMVESGTILFGAIVVPQSRASIEELVTGARDVWSALGRWRQSTGLSLCLSIHRGSLFYRQDHHRQISPLAGDLIVSQEWTQFRSDRICVTDEALAGLNLDESYLSE